MVDAKPEVLAIIPARGGSKGIPRKNIKSFAGHPLIAYSIAAGVQAESVTRVIVSTDDEEIATVAREYGAEVPFLRPEELAQDQTLDLPVFQHALRWLEEHEGYRPEVVVQLRPTSPVRPPHLVDEAVRILLEHPEADSVRGVVPAGQNPHKMWRIDPQSGMMKNLLDVPGVDEPYNAPRQILPPVYWQTGHIDAIRPRVIHGGSMSGRIILPVMVDPAYTVDIDTPKDWARSEWLVWYSDLEIVYPGRRRRPLPQRVDLVVLDFDGVMTDNRVWVNEEGREMVAANRSDSLGLGYLRREGVKVVVLSTETNPVVAARCRKLNLPVYQGVADKAAALPGILQEMGVLPENTIYVGNDSNDIPCFPLVACALVVEDAQTAARRAADIILTRKGGHGAVREVCDILLQRMGKFA
ncbi:acylneuraminate cytidylyltransferase [Anaerolinea thermophila]|uniref:N-acylneuraminate cytidylyltransferase n=1 Tax=Anaerolinea thermophila (strain DSM 14523 / JCM 11388 / NBRC 100420 / UNI-1) TaxID=926569 RepID=E8N1S5_ANATU|nr:acylneuraminate cytidylyltransferase [Anaerolinea thermophila]BAJ62680.1 putative N-acylneuraminate cytidylyltransferase [Anaerolinea thermophila UNI-1]